MKNLQELNEELLSANKDLKERNTELLRSNNELTSFNYIASHDLQEPLRKIQVFISRIFEDKELVLSDKNKDYFNKMQISANRMQILIDNLLAYSKVNGTHKIFENVNLNFILDNVLNELAQTATIEDNKAIIKHAALPEIKGIPFQLKQLFTNLIDNALKYGHPERNTVIDIQSVVVEGKDIDDPRADKNKSYFNITFADNGMGFEQEYAEKIFALFQRLHDKQSFSGTGIGLAICKKVAENHAGFMSATSVLNEGATFSIYIPTL